MLEEFQYRFHLHSLFANKSQPPFMLLKVELEFIKKMYLYPQVVNMSVTK